MSESEIRRRATGSGESADGAHKAAEENEITPEEFQNYDKQEAPKPAPSTEDTIENSEIMQNIPKKYRNYWIRFVVTWILIGAFAVIVYGGAIPLSILILAVQLICFNEIITIGYKVYRTYNLPWFRTLSWYFLFTFNYYLYGDFLSNFFKYYLMKRSVLNTLLSAILSKHSFVSYCFYLTAFVWFILSLRQGSYFSQFTMFGFTHLVLLVITTQSHLIVSNLFSGMIWFLLPVCCVICNDIMAYMFGFFLGRTKLIALSPKKTWEGFIGGAFSTVLLAVAMAQWLCAYDSMVCPVSLNETTHEISYECERHYVFTLQEYDISNIPLLNVITKRHSLLLFPFLGHTLIISLFVSIVGPFGGFFASGFKRAFKVKDFGDVLPGHGGLMDRFDCQLLAGSFVYVYIRNFIGTNGQYNLHNLAVSLSDSDQLKLYSFLQNELLDKQLLCGLQICEPIPHTGS
ncbi:phosphatidate cytidylyltransferase, photoreceptor-specific-like [Symsagittifera roscoffensis]|uniref:phosphatidate cytidylyltransferase, photoreceptor-specific-like n=1 Tax=Symsagittifera roscoffensis TaxID=84072 RepID=UPI00307C8213